MTLPQRLTATVLLLAVVLSGLLLLRPAETTLAAWSDEVTVAVPALRTGGVRMEVTPTGRTATVALTGDAAGTWRPSSVQVSAGGKVLTGADLAGSRVEYRLGSGAAPYSATLGGSLAAFPVSGNERLEGAHTLALAVQPSDRALIRYGGQDLTLTTTLDGATAAPATWTAGGSWTAQYRLPTGPSVTGPQCVDSATRATLSWGWDRGALSQDVARWSLQAADGSAWREIGSYAADQRSTTLRARDFGIVDFARYTLRVVAVLPDGTTLPSTGTTAVRVGRLLLGTVSCA